MATTTITTTSSTNKRPVDSILFVDDQLSHVSNVATCGNKVSGILIDGIQGHPPAISWQSPLVTQFRKRLGEGSNADAVLSILYKRRYQLLYDVNAGINKKGIAYIKDWVKKTRASGSQHPAVLFDWDRTISVLEGLEFFRRTHFSDMEDIIEQEAAIYGITDDERRKFTLESYLEVFLGGKNRVAHLRNLFDYLLKYGATVGILTNNTGCKMPAFKDLVKQLFQQRPFQLICGMDFKYNKMKAIDHYFKGVCEINTSQSSTKNIHKQEKNTDISQYNVMNNNNNNNNSSSNSNSNTNSLALSTNSNTNSLALSNNNNTTPRVTSFNLNRNNNNANNFTSIAALQKDTNNQNGSNFGEIWKNMLETATNENKKEGGKRKTRKHKSIHRKRKDRKTRHS